MHAELRAECQAVRWYQCRAGTTPPVPPGVRPCPRRTFTLLGPAGEVRKKSVQKVSASKGPSQHLAEVAIGAHGAGT
jgi:hypothetical protein